ncbi:MAG TPA: TauD/TfdA family dioxygenase [Ramlibacter sp.]|nr:TauD/TfdA family dioxygenase [Ramlibacter sp.]
MTIKTRRLANALGAAVLDVDLSKAMEPATFRAIRKAWVEHLVLVFPGQQNLTPEQHVAFSRLFGELDRNETTPSYRLPGCEEVIAITNRATREGKPSPSKDVGRKWHSDLDFTLRPTMGSLLWCGELPDVGGDTMFANMYEALETLSP